MKEKLDVPCGCKMWTENGVFTIIPCSIECKYYLYVIEQSKKQGNKIIMR